MLEYISSVMLEKMVFLAGVGTNEFSDFEITRTNSTCNKLQKMLWRLFGTIPNIKHYSQY